MHRNLSYYYTDIFYLLHELEADDTAVLFKCDLIKDTATHQPEVTINVSEAKPEQGLYKIVIQTSNDDPMQGIGSANLVAVNEVDLRCETLPKPCHFSGIVLCVPVGIEDDILGADAKPVRSAAPYPPFRGWWITRSLG